MQKKFDATVIEKDHEIRQLKEEVGGVGGQAATGWLAGWLSTGWLFVNASNLGVCFFSLF